MLQRHAPRRINHSTTVNLLRWIHGASLPRSPSENKTIYALSTPPGKGGVAVVRVSGPEAVAVWRHVVRPVYVPNSTRQPQRVPRSRFMHRCRVVDINAQGVEETLDDGLAVFFQGALLPALPTTNPVVNALSQIPIHTQLSLPWNFIYIRRPRVYGVCFPRCLVYRV